MSKKIRVQRKIAATLTIHNAADMTPAGRRRIARWMDEQRMFFLMHSNDMSRRFTGRYYYDPKGRV